MPSKKVSEQLHAAFISFLETFFVERDYENTMGLFRSSAHGFGAGLEETGRTYKDIEKLIAGDISREPEPFKYEIITLDISVITDQAGLVLCELKNEPAYQEEGKKQNTIRISLVWTGSEEGWFIEQIHISLPAVVPLTNEGSEDKKMAEQNRILQHLVDQKTSQLNRAVDYISKMVTIDNLTGLYNPLKIDEILEREVQRSQRYENNLTLILIDLDNGKSIYEEQGHLAGDRLLKDFAELLTERVRKTDILGRWGGEQFIIICQESGLEEAKTVVEHLRSNLAERAFDFVGVQTASFGITEFRKKDTSESIISRAGSALQKARENGGNRAEWV
ncbi:MAG: diguanylate cyclase [Spirochaetales bacterium]|nr:diguanylate cyclase [Spirochaetales bacterium]MCF7938062.1 diguanylate cyclase [Spirochaetales bacterium]